MDIYSDSKIPATTTRMVQMLELTERRWEPIRISDIFDSFENGKGKGRNHLIEVQHDGIEYIGATNRHNGVLCFVSVNSESRDMIQRGNCIGFIRNGNGAAGYAIYKHEPFISTPDVIYGYASWINEYTGLFFVAAQDLIQNKYGHGHKRTPQRLIRDSVMLPVDNNGCPDWLFMSNYIRERVSTHIVALQKLIRHRIEQIGSQHSIIPTKTSNWGSVQLDTLGEIKSGKDVYEAERIPGQTPYITSGSKNNGIGYFVGNTNNTLDAGYIAINRNGSVGQAFYHLYPSLMGNDCRKLHIEDADKDEYVGLFIAMCITMQHDAFSYSRKLGTARAKKMQIMLPLDWYGKPNYSYMQQYIKSIFAKHCKVLLDFLKAKAQEIDR